MITHDRYFLDNLTEWTLELDRSKDVPYKGNYSAYLEKKAKRLEVDEREEEAKQARSARTGMDQVRAEGASDQVQGPYRRLRPAREAAHEERRQGRDHDPGGRALAAR